MIWALLIVLAGGVLLFSIVSGANKPKKHHKLSASLDRDLVASRWEEVERLVDGGGSGPKSAVSEADKLLDYAMRGLGARGETMAERLKGSESRLSNKEAVWQAHKLRNHLAHEVGFEITPSHAKQAVTSFHQALKDLGALR